MTNEELVLCIQKGERDKLLLLWEGVNRFIIKVAKSYLSCCNGCYGVELEDLTQSGFIAMVKAASAYSSEGGASFVTFLGYYLKVAFAEAANRRNEKQQKDPINSAESIHKPLRGNDDEKIWIIDTIPAPDAFEDVERKIYREQLRATLEEIMGTISPRGAEVLRLHFFEGLELTEIAACKGVSTEAIRAAKNKGLNEMRKSANTSRGAKLLEYLDSRTNYYQGMGYGSFTRTQTSPIERLVIKREAWAKSYEKAMRHEEKACIPHSGIYRP